MKSKYATRIFMNGSPFNVQLGDTVFFYENAQLDTDPSIGTIISIGENNICDIAVIPNTGVRIIVKTGVCVVGDPHLQTNPNYKKRGAWSPRMDFATLANFLNQPVS